MQASSKKSDLQEQKEEVTNNSRLSALFRSSRAAVSSELGTAYQLVAAAGLIIDAIALSAALEQPVLTYLVLALFTATLLAIKKLGRWGEYLFILVFFLTTVPGYSLPLTAGTLGIYAMCAAWFGQGRFLPSLVLFGTSVAAEYLNPWNEDSNNVSYVLFSVLAWFIFTFGIGLVLLFYNTKVRHLHGIGEQEREKATQTEDRIRHQIATDLHDVTAADLAHIALVAQDLAKAGHAGPEELARLASLASTASGRLRPLILQIDSERESSTLSEVIKLSTTMLTSRNIRLKSGLPHGVDKHITRQQRLTGALVIREGATNILKYAPRGSEAEVEIELGADGTLSILLSSSLNTKTLNDSPQHHVPTGGYGLANLKDRVESEDGSISFGPIAARWILHATLPAFKELPHEH